MYFPQGKAQIIRRTWALPWEQCTFSRKRPQFFGEQSCFELFLITTISCLFLYELVTYYWKGLKKNYNFVVKNTSIKIDMKKINVIKFKHIYSPKNMIALHNNLRPFLPKEHSCSPRQLRTFFFPWGHDCSQGN
jgi:hypothetical protein